MELQLKRIRRERAMSQQQLADSLGVDVRTIGNWERGVTLMSIEQVWNCAEALGSTPNDLCGWYLEHPEDAVAQPGIADPMARELVGCYESLNPDGRTNLLGVARGLRALPEWRAGDGGRAVQAQGRASA